MSEKVRKLTPDEQAAFKAALRKSATILDDLTLTAAALRARAEEARDE